MVAENPSPESEYKWNVGREALLSGDVHTHDSTIGQMWEREDASDLSALEDVLRFFGWRWAGFWAWLDSIGQVVQPVPTVRRVDTSAPERPEAPAPPK